MPYRHVLARLARRACERAYHALDVYARDVAAGGRPEGRARVAGGGCPLVTTRVGQASELVLDGENGLLADVDDVDALVAAVSRIHGDAALGRALRSAGKPTAEANAEERLDGRWAALLDGFVEKGAARAT